MGAANTRTDDRAAKGLIGRLAKLSPPQAAGLSAAVAFLVYLPTAGYPFLNWDDPTYVTRNPGLLLSGWDFVRWAFTTFLMGNWNPLVWFSLKLDYSVWGMNPTGFHLTNVTLHALNSFLVVILLDELLRAACPGEKRERTLFPVLLVGVVFAVHPLHVESVAWISERKDLLFAVFYLTSLLVWLRWLRPREKPKLALYALSLVLYMLSLMSKPMAVSLPVILVLLDVYPLQRTGRGIRLLVEKLPFIAITVAACATAILAQATGKAVAMAESLPFLERLGNAARALVFYVMKTVLPINLSPFYALRPADGYLAVLGFTAALGILLLLAFCTARLRKEPVWFVLVAAFIIMLLPTLGIIQVGGQFAADRYMYLSIIPLVTGIVIVAKAGARRLEVPVSVAVWLCGIASAMMVVLTINQMTHWRNSEALWMKTLAEDDEIPVAHFNLGNYYLSINDLARAEAEWTATVRLAPTHSEAQNQLGNIAYLQGDMIAALGRYEQAVAGAPGNAEALYNYAMILDRLGMTSKARENYVRFVELAPQEYQQQVAAALRRIQQID
jgi:hypothetical protein